MNALLNRLDHYPVIAQIFDYPSEGFTERSEAVVAELQSRNPEAAADLARFVALIPRGEATDLDDIQELYTRTFDVLAMTTLDVGYVLFGDDYKRGQLLANLNREHAETGNDCGTELADHLPNLLRLMPLLNDADLARDIVRDLIAPALRAMVREFGDELTKRRNAFYKKKFKTQLMPSDERTTLYKYTLTALYTVLQADFDLVPVEYQVPGHTHDFLAHVQAEVACESKASKKKSPVYTARGTT